MKRFLLAAAGLSILAGPMAASAQPDQGRRDDHPSNATRQAPAYRPAPQQGFQRPQQSFQRPQQSFQRPQPGPTPYRGGFNQGAQTTWRGAGPGGAPMRAQAIAPRQSQNYRGGQVRARNGYAGQFQRSWNGRVSGGVRLQDGWWRGRPGFNGYVGRREGFWFAPGWGYYRVDPAWWGFDWAVGAVVPYQLQSYYVSDYWDYGLPAPPYGCEYIFLGDQIVLMDMGSGQILEIVGAY